MFFEKLLIIAFFINLFWIWRFSSPYFEKFYFDNGRIVTKKFKEQEIIEIPTNAVFVLSYTLVDNSVSSKNSCTVNIVDEKAEIVLQKLNEDPEACAMVAYRHRLKNGMIYDSEYIEHVFNNKVVYSFVFNNETQQIFNELKRTVILPDSLKSRVTIESNGFDVIIDKDR